MLLSLMNLLASKADASVKQGNGTAKATGACRTCTRTVGILGYGHMGSAFASKLTGMGCRILACDPYRDDVDGDLKGRCATWTWPL